MGEVVKFGDCLFYGRILPRWTGGRMDDHDVFLSFSVFYIRMEPVVSVKHQMELVN